MNPEEPPPPTGSRRLRVDRWVPALVVLVIASILWASFLTDSLPGRSGSSGASATEGSDPAGSDGDATAKESATAGTEPDHVKPGELAESVRRYRKAQKRLADRVSAQLKRRTAPFEFRVASYNVLGDSHTGPGGNKRGFPDGSPRMNLVIGALRANSIDVVGFQEFEASQYGFFTSRAGEYSLYPGLSLGDKSVRFNIAWRSSMWTLVEAHTLSIPYAGGSRIEMPVILLESTETGRRAWFANFHNPADTPRLGNNARWRSEAASIEIAHLTDLAQTQGYPVIATGDYNERAEIFCRFTAGGVFSAAAGGSTGGACAPPSGMQVDWIFGSSAVEFSNYAVSNQPQASDHAMVHSTATLLADPLGAGAGGESDSGQ